MRPALLILLLTIPVVACAQVSPAEGGPPPVWDLARVMPGEPSWAGALRLRRAEDVYRDGGGRSPYPQIRAQTEASIGNHGAALRWWDGAGRARDSVGILPEGTRAIDALNVLAQVADTAQVLMINERHHAASDRLLTLDLLRRLYDRGFRYFAAETFNDTDSLLNERAYPTGATGTYTNEPVFAEVVREARRLGYTLVPYEITDAQHAAAPQGLTSQQHRDRSQAQNLHDRIFRRDPNARVLVHAGFRHIVEEANDDWSPMALYFRAITGIDPVTVDQTVLSERSVPAFEHPVYRAAAQAGYLDGSAVVLTGPAGDPLRPSDFAVDIQVLTPRTRYEEGRPMWMRLGGRRAGSDVAVPECRVRWCFVEARATGEPAEAIPLDRAEVTGVETARLFLPAGEAVEIRVFSESGGLLRSFHHTSGRSRRDP